MSANFSGTTPLRAINETTGALEPIYAPLNDESVTGNEALIPIAANTGIGGNGGVWYSIPLFQGVSTSLQRQQQNRLAVSKGAVLSTTYNYFRDVPVVAYPTEMEDIFSTFNTDSGSNVYDELFINTDTTGSNVHIFVTFIIYAV